MRTFVLIGQIYGRLTVVRPGPLMNKQMSFVCKCECGVEKTVRARLLVTGKAKSCGCLRREVTGALRRKHAMSDSNTFRIWAGMIDRCERAAHKNYATYGGAGIRVCERWRDSFEAFLSDMGERPAGMSIDRIDSAGNYEPGNCRWATQREQNRNKRNNVVLEFRGECKTLVEWSEVVGIPYGTLSSRIRDYKWPIEKALTEPVR